MARIAGIDIPRSKRALIALTYIKGIGKTTSGRILAKADIDESIRVEKLTEGEVARIRESIETNEDRVKLNNVEAFPDYENNSFDLTITYEIVGRNIPTQELQFVLQSSR